MLNKLESEERLRLMRFVCSFAWADLEVQDEERELIANMVERFGLDEDERKQVQGWLKTPPRPEEVDPADIPRSHRKLFLDAAREIIAADGVVDEDELENLTLFRMLLSD